MKSTKIYSNTSGNISSNKKDPQLSTFSNFNVKYFNTQSSHVTANSLNTANTSPVKILTSNPNNIDKGSPKSPVIRGKHLNLNLVFYTKTGRKNKENPQEEHELVFKNEENKSNDDCNSNNNNNTKFFHRQSTVNPPLTFKNLKLFDENKNTDFYKKSPVDKGILCNKLKNNINDLSTDHPPIDKGNGNNSKKKIKNDLLTLPKIAENPHHLNKLSFKGLDDCPVVNTDTPRLNGSTNVQKNYSKTKTYYSPELKHTKGLSQNIFNDVNFIYNKLNNGIQIDNDFKTSKFICDTSNDAKDKFFNSHPLTTKNSYKLLANKAKTLPHGYKKGKHKNKGYAKLNGSDLLDKKYKHNPDYFHDHKLKINSDDQYIDTETVVYDPFAEIKSCNLYLSFRKYPQPKISTNHIGNYIKSFAVNSYTGIARNYNEDKVSIILYVSKPKNFEGTWPNISYLAIYDGHAGNKCCDFLRDKLHNYIVKNEYFPKDPVKALEYGIQQADADFLNQIAIPEQNKSGSCANILLIIDNMCYIANIGDSRAIASFNNGKLLKALSTDHKPNSPDEYKRIMEHGGSIYLSMPSGEINLDINNENVKVDDYNNISNFSNEGIYRINPGHLSVSRAFGDAAVKLNKDGEKTGILVSTPEIISLDLDKDELDFILMGCDGVFEKLKNGEICGFIWDALKDNELMIENIHGFSGNIVDIILKSALKRKSLDNVTSIFLTFKNYYKKFKSAKKNRISDN